MTVMIRCNICGNVVEGNEASNHEAPYVWHDAEGDKLTFNIFPINANHEGTAINDTHTCNACVGEAMARMVEKMFPVQFQVIKAVKDDKDTEPGEGADSNLQQLRVSRPVSESSSSKHKPCPNCINFLNQEPTLDCISPALHSIR